MSYDGYILDDEVQGGGKPLDDEARARLAKWVEEWEKRHPFTRGGAYRNRLGHLVTWNSTEDGSYQVLQTWPE